MEYIYPGDELNLFKEALTWKKYWFSKIEKYISGKVLEVGCGNGANTELILEKDNIRLTCIDPDKTLIDEITNRLNKSVHKYKLIDILKCTVHDLRCKKCEFDCVMYIDVLEHIENDQIDLQQAINYLKKGGYLIVLCPAFPILFSPFDSAIGHFRRYKRRSLGSISINSVELIDSYYLDSVGFFASLINKLLLKQSVPTEKQIQFWDKFIVPVSKITDKFLSGYFGKSVICVWRKL